MLVNSVCKGFFTNRLVVDFSIRIVIGTVMLAIFLIASSFTEHSDHDPRAKQVNLIIREIGHRLLLQAGDLTSRVLPVTETKEGTFLLQFENEFAFKHDSLMALSRVLLPKTQFPSGYTVTVHECANADIVYGFQLNHTSPDILACRGRSEPQGCYTIEFSFPDFYAKIEQKKADIGQVTEEHKTFTVDPSNSIPRDSYQEATGTKESKTTTNDYDVNPLAEQLKSFKVDSQEANSIPTTIVTEELKETTSDYSLVNLVYSGTLVFFGVTLLIARFGKVLKPVAVQKQNLAIIKGSVPDLAALGKFSLDVKDQRLLLGSEVISLTDKECKILELLNRNFGELIARETLMQEVWINEGVITGRSLDMFVSKLRKKLSSDPDLRITNVHGKGYKLEVPEV